MEALYVAHAHGNIEVLIFSFIIKSAHSIKKLTMPAILSLLLLFTLPSAAETFVIGSDFSKDIPPLYWNDTCSQKKSGFGWLLQQRL